MFAKQHLFPADANGIKRVLIMIDERDIIKFVPTIVGLDAQSSR